MPLKKKCRGDQEKRALPSLSRPSRTAMVPHSAARVPRRVAATPARPPSRSFPPPPRQLPRALCAPSVPLFPSSGPGSYRRPFAHPPSCSFPPRAPAATAGPLHQPCPPWVPFLRRPRGPAAPGEIRSASLPPPGPLPSLLPPMPLLFIRTSCPFPRPGSPRLSCVLVTEVPAVAV